MQHLVLCSLGSARHHVDSLSTRTLGSYLLDHLPSGQLQITVLDFAPGTTPEVMLEAVTALRPDVLGVSCYVWSYVALLSLCELAKRELPGLVTLAGGPELSYDDEDLAALRKRFPSWDVLFQGEGETALLAYFQRPVDDRPSAGAVIVGAPLADLDTIGGPLMERFPEHQPSDHFTIETARGCRWLCSYCSFALSRLREVRTKSNPLVRREVEWAARAGKEVTIYAESYLNAGPGTVQGRVDLLRDAGASHGRKHLFTIDHRTLTRAEAKALSQVECIIDLGIQTTNPVADAKVNRRNHLRRFQDVVGWFREDGIEFYVDLIPGLPGDGFADFMESIAYLERLGIHFINITPLQVLPGTPMYRDRKSLGLECLPENHEVVRSPWMSADELARCGTISHEYHSRNDIFSRYFPQS